MTQSIPNPIAGRNTHRRRGSALMVALALLMMLAVFAALFLTSSRFDQDAATANIDYIRMDLYAEGVAQYAQSCLVYGLWGFDDKPLNNDEVDPYKGWGPSYGKLDDLLTTGRVVGGKTVRGLPGPDSPFDYYGGQVLVADEDGNTITTTNDQTFFFPNFWLGDPRAQAVTDPSSGDNNPAHTKIVNSAFAPRGIGVHTNRAGTAMPAYAPWYDPNYKTNLDIQADWADMDNDGRADTPWLFTKPVGNGLYMRVAVRVEDTSSRINLNTADHPLYVTAANNEEGVTRQALYPGYPFLISSNVAWPRIFPVLSLGADPNVADPNDLTKTPPWVDSVGGFLSEMNLAGLTGNANIVWRLNDGAAPAAGQDANMPGRFGMFTTTYTPTWPDASSFNAGGTTFPRPLFALLGDPNSQPDPGTGIAFSGRLGGWLSTWRSGNMAGWTNVPSSWWTYDPNGLARRLEAAANYTGNATLKPDQDRPYSSDETFALIAKSRGISAGFPVKSRLESLLPAMAGSTSGPQFGTALTYQSYRRLFTTYSWTWDICPYGEDPSGTAGVVDPGSYRKVNLNTCTAREFEEAMQAAGRHMVAGATPGDINQLAGQMAANLLDYRDRPMTRMELRTYLDWRLTYIGTHPGATSIPQPAAPTNPTDPSVSIGWPNAIQLEWDEEQWRHHVEQVTDPTGNTPYTVAMEGAYLNGAGPNQWQTQRSNPVMVDQIAARVSYDSPTFFAGANGGGYGLDRAPFITEVYAQINNYDPKTNPPGGTPTISDQMTAWGDPSNYFAIELYNPYPDPISIENLSLIIDMPEDAVTTTPLQFDFWRRNFNVDVADPLLPTIIPAGRYLILCENAAAFSGLLPLPKKLLYDVRNTTGAAAFRFVFYPGSRIRLITRASTIKPDGRGVAPNEMIVDEVPKVVNDSFTWPAGPILSSRVDMDNVRWDRDGGFWLQNGNNAWRYLEAVGGDLTAGLGTFNGFGPMQTPGQTPFFAVPSIANQTTASFLSPAEVTNLLRKGPDIYLENSTTNVAPSVKMDAAWNWTPGADDLRLSLFNRSYAPGAADGAIQDQTANRYSGLAQSLMDFITTNDFACDGLDRNGKIIADPSVPSTTVDPALLRVPGRLNVNTISDEFLQLDTNHIPLLASLDPTATSLSPLDAAFWTTLRNFRDLQGIYGAYDPNNPLVVPDRWATAVANPSTANYVSHLGIAQLGDLCNVQDRNTPLFCGFWQTRASLNYTGVQNTTTHVYGAAPDYLLPAQQIRRFARNANLLTTRSDTYMVTIRVEIVRPNYDKTSGALTRIDPFGQREYMYLMDRSYCSQAPQQAPAAGDPFLNARMNKDFIPPRVWRMSIPSYAAH